METIQTRVGPKNKSWIILILAGIFLIYSVYLWWGFSYFNLIDLLVKIIIPLPALGVFILKADSRRYRVCKILFIIIFALTIISGPLIYLEVNYVSPWLNNSLVGKLGNQALQK